MSETKQKPMLTLRFGTWLYGDPIGVNCSICGWWQHLPTPTCPRCKASLKLKKPKVRKIERYGVDKCLKSFDRF